MNVFTRWNIGLVYDLAGIRLKEEGFNAVPSIQARLYIYLWKKAGSVREAAFFVFKAEPDLEPAKYVSFPVWSNDTIRIAYSFYL